MSLKRKKYWWSLSLHHLPVLSLEIQKTHVERTTCWQTYLSIYELNKWLWRKRHRASYSAQQKRCKRRRFLPHVCAPGLLPEKPSVETNCYFRFYQQAILLPQRGASLLQLIEGSQEFRVLTHQEAIVRAILKEQAQQKKMQSLLTTLFHNTQRHTRI